MQDSHQILCQLLDNSAMQRVLLLGERAAEVAQKLESFGAVSISAESWQYLGRVSEGLVADPVSAGFPAGNLARNLAGKLAGFDLVYLTDLPASINAAPVSAELAQCLSALQSGCRGEMLLEYTHRCGQATDNQFFALGFSRVSEGNISERFALYRYSLHSYKTAPDWLNSKHWANPERWNLD